MTKILDGKELAGFIKERQANLVRAAREESNGKKFPKLLIIRDNDNPVIEKYVELKKKYGEDIGVEVIDFFNHDIEILKHEIKNRNHDDTISGIIVQLPLVEKEKADEIVSLITPEKDVDGLSGKGKFDSATATAINWLLAGYNVNLENKKIALVGEGRLVGAPLCKMFKKSGLNVSTFVEGDSLDSLPEFDVIITATGVPHLIKNELVSPGTILVDAGTASEGGVLVGDIEESLREREDLAALTPRIGGVGPMTVSVLFDNVISSFYKIISERK